jgi:hypothetical protein
MALVSEKSAPQDVSHGSFTNLLMKSYCLYPIFHVSGKQIGWDPMKIPKGWHVGSL